ncbi:MAG: SipW-dependent-type signal peptide-containing protein [Lachnospiraceae bacterium]|nr:SipW-dependent-type signal peptide-containing protein [Lachnospiraceae bacterium]
MKNKKIMAVMAMIGCIAAAGTGFTLSYLTDKGSITNDFTVGDQDIDLKEPDWDPEDGDGINLYPGYTVYKNPTIKNITSNKNGEETAYARMIVYIEDEKGNLITSQEAIDLIKTTIRYDSTYTGTYDKKGEGRVLVQGRIPGYSLAALKDIPMINPVFTLDKSRTTANKLVCNYMGKDGTGILKIGEEATLFTDIVIPIDWNQTQFKICGNFQLRVEAESIQTSGFAAQEDAYEALDAEIAAGTLQNITESGTLQSGTETGTQAAEKE